MSALASGQRALAGAFAKHARNAKVGRRSKNPTKVKLGGRVGTRSIWGRFPH